MTRKKPDGVHFKRVRTELCDMLGFEGDPDALPADQAMRLDVVFALKLSLDEMRSRLYRGEAIDNVEMRQLADTLERYLPAQSKPDPTPALYRKDPHQAMEEILDRWLAADQQDRRERGLSPRIHDEKEQQARIDALEAEVIELRAMLPAADPTVALPAPDRVIDPPTGDIVGPLEQSDRPSNMRAPHGPDNPKLRPGSQIIDGKVVPVPPQAVSGAEAKRRMEASNAARATMQRDMS